VSNIAPLVDSTNVTLEWPRPEGRVEMYVVRWAAEGEEDPPHTKNITEVNPSAPPGAEDQTVRVLIGDLMPGVKYLFEIHTVSYHLDSDITKLAARTSELLLN
jgi:cadherin 5 type 2 (VE-cadherin)